MNIKNHQFHKILCFLLLACTNVWGNGILSVSPTSAEQGETNVKLTVALDPDGIPPPPPFPPDNVRIGTLEGTSISRNGNDVTATFTFPNNGSSGLMNVEVFFGDKNGSSPPPDLTYTLNNAFEIIAGANAPEITITTADTIVANEITDITINGTTNEHVTGNMTWHNALTGDEANFPAESPWEVIIPIEPGTNKITITAQNSLGATESDTVRIARQSEGPLYDYVLVDTGQANSYNTSGGVIPSPNNGEVFYGQDAQFQSAQPNFIDNGDGTITDVNTGLMWQKSSNTDGDSDIDADDKLSFADAGAYASTLNTEAFAGHNDWRLPSIKELYSLIDFRGLDPSGFEGTDTSNLIPFIDTDFFDFAYGDTDAGERIIDSQYASNTLYVDSSEKNLMFGVNFADGRIKGYELQLRGEDKTFFVMCVRGNDQYGINDFLDNGDETITDRATRLMWTKNDSSSTYNWEDALNYVQTLNNENHKGYSDWRLPNIKELQSLVDYTRSPGTSASAAIDPLFNASAITNEEDIGDYGYYWSSTTHVKWVGLGDNATYIAFGRGLGYLNEQWQDIHGAGCQRSDPKSGDPADFPTGQGPQGDAIRIFNFVRAVRDAEVPDSLPKLTVTADNTHRPPGEENPAFTGTITGLQVEDNITVSYSSTASPDDPPGTYDIVPSLSDPDDKLKNYEVTINNGILTITADSWTNVTNNGFNFPIQDTAPEVEVYNGYLYVATSPIDPAQAKLWRSPTGDPNSFEEITNFDPPLDGVRSIHAFGTTELDGGYIWLGTGNPTKGGMIYQSRDGLSWIGISEYGFDENPLLTGTAPHMVVFQGTGDDMPYLYAGMGSHGGGTPGQVWRTPYTNTDPSNWELLVDFASFNENIQTITYFYEWNDTLYFGTDGGGQLWDTTNGVSFFRNNSVANGFGDENNKVLSSFVVFGNQFYVTTNNNNGGQIWRSSDATNWEQITSNAFDKGIAAHELRSLRTSFGKIWVTAYTKIEFSNGTPIWRSDNGSDWVQSNADGFGNINNNGQNAVTIGFKDHQYFTGPNDEDGAQVWRALMVTEDDKADDDGDGVSNINERYAGTDPNNSNSFLTVTKTTQPTTETLRVNWPTTNGVNYRITQSTDLQTWIPVPGANAIGDGSEQSLDITIPSDNADMFFRIEVLYND